VRLDGEWYSDVTRTCTKPALPLIIRPADSERDAHQHARCSIVLQHNLVDNSGTGFPKLDAVLLARALQEIEDFLVGVK
jgi:hypothetical protein